jgi:hypothetical protein
MTKMVDPLHQLLRINHADETAVISRHVTSDLRHQPAVPAVSTNSTASTEVVHVAAAEVGDPVEPDGRTDREKDPERPSARHGRRTT